MKRYEIKKDNRNFGHKCDWYAKENLGAVNAMNPVRMVGNKVFPAAYFVVEVKMVRDEMREFNTNYEVRNTVAGPFSCEANATEWAEMYAA